MSEKTNIEWCTSTGSPWIGCTKVSPGCKNCYAADLDAQRFSRTIGGGTKEHPISHWGKGAPRLRTKGFWKDAVRWNKQAGEMLYPLKLRERPRIFPSLCDWLDDEVPIEWLHDFLKLIYDTPNLDWLLLTKRPENFIARIGEAYIYEVRHGLNKDEPFRLWLTAWESTDAIYPINVWIGTSVEDQQRAEERIPALLKIPAKVRFLSVEPLLGPVRIISPAEALPWELAATGMAWSYSNCHYERIATPMLHWVIVGGESGPGARPCNVAWIESIVQQCRVAEVPCFVKQLGQVVIRSPDDRHLEFQDAVKRKVFDGANGIARFIPKHPKGGDPAEWPEHLRVRQFPKL